MSPAIACMIVIRVSMQAVQRRQDAAGRKAHAALMQKRDSRMFSCTLFNHKYWLNRLEKGGGGFRV